MLSWTLWGEEPFRFWDFVMIRKWMFAQLFSAARKVSSSLSWSAKNAMTHPAVFASFKAALVAVIGSSRQRWHNLSHRWALCKDHHSWQIWGTVQHKQQEEEDKQECKLIQSVWPWRPSHHIESRWRVRKITPVSDTSETHEMQDIMLIQSLYIQVNIFIENLSGCNKWR